MECKIMTTAERSADLYFSKLYSNTNWFTVLRGQTALKYTASAFCCEHNTML